MPTRWKFSGLPIENDRLIRGCRLVHVHVANSMFSLALSTCFLLAMTSDVQAHSLQLSLGPVLVHHGLPSSRSSFCGKGSLIDNYPLWSGSFSNRTENASGLGICQIGKFGGSFHCIRFPFEYVLPPLPCLGENPFQSPYVSGAVT